MEIWVEWYSQIGSNLMLNLGEIKREGRTIYGKRNNKRN